MSMEENGGFERLNWKTWLWTPKTEDMALNTKLWTVALNAKLKRDSDSERLKLEEMSGYECQTEDMALNA